jgi:hypothetical protein
MILRVFLRFLHIKLSKIGLYYFKLTTKFEFFVKIATLVFAPLDIQDISVEFR